MPFSASYTCTAQGHKTEELFDNRAQLLQMHEAGGLACSHCGSKRITLDITAPAIVGSTGTPDLGPEPSAEETAARKVRTGMMDKIADDHFSGMMI